MKHMSNFNKWPESYNNVLRENGFNGAPNIFSKIYLAYFFKFFAVFHFDKKKNNYINGKKFMGITSMNIYKLMITKMP